MKSHLNNTHRNTYDAIVRMPASHNLQWRDVRSLLLALAEVVEEPNGHLKVTRNGQTLILHPEGHKDVGSEVQLKKLREFLENSGGAPAPAEAEGINLLVVIDHREARIYRTELHNSVPQKVVPHDPDNNGRYLHYVQNDSNGQRRPELKSYYEAIAKAVHGAHSILVFGGGTGASSAMEAMIAEFKHHHKDIAAKIVGAVVINDHHTTEEQLLAKAREFYETLAAHPAAVHS